MPGLRLSPADPAESPVLIRTLLKRPDGSLFRPHPLYHIEGILLQRFKHWQTLFFTQSVFCKDYSQSKHLHLFFDCNFKRRVPAKNQAWFRSLLLLLSLKISVYISAPAFERLHVLWYLHAVDQEARLVYNLHSRSGCLVVYWQDACRIAPRERLMTLNSAG